MEKTLRNFESLYTFNCINGTFVYNICDVIDYLELNDTDYFESGAIIMDWAKKYNLSVYSAPRDIFSMVEAISCCERDRTYGVIVEDLS